MLTNDELRRLSNLLLVIFALLIIEIIIHFVIPFWPL